MRVRGRSASAVALLALALWAPAAFAAEQRAKPADEFVDSIGVNVHNTYGDTPYSQWSRVLRELRALGVRHVRDGLKAVPDRVYTQAQLKRLAALPGFGARATLIMGLPDGRDGTLPELVRTARGLGGVVAALEGPNEYDISGVADWAPPLRSYQQQLFRRAASTDGLKRVPVLAPSLVNFPSIAIFGDLRSSITGANLHPYPGGRPPPADGLGREVSEQRRVSGVKPVTATETGYHNAVNQPGGQPGVSEIAAGDYIPRLLLDHFTMGLTRTFLYELIDEFSDPGRRQQESNWGLLRHDFSAKPAALAVANLTRLFGDPGPPISAGALRYDLSAPAGVRSRLTQRRDGTFLLALWQSGSVWDLAARRDVEPPVQLARVALGQAVGRVRVYRPSRTRGATQALNAPRAIDVALSGDPVVLELPRAKGRALPKWSKVRLKKGKAPLVIERTGAHFSGATASVRVRCALRASVCSGRVSARVQRSRRSIALRSSALLLAAGNTLRVTLPASSRARRAIRGQRRPLMKVRVHVRGYGPTVRRKVRLKKR